MITREQAVDQLVEIDVAKWGEAEREASRRAHSALSHGLALNKLAHHDITAIDAQLAMEAKSVMTEMDRRQLRAARG